MTPLKWFSGFLKKYRLATRADDGHCRMRDRKSVHFRNDRR